MTAAEEPQQAPRPRRRRGAAESLGSIVLVFESIIVFLGGLVAFGLDALPDSIPRWWGVVGGAVLALAMFVAAGLLRRRWAIIVGWVLQALVLASALLVPAMVIVAAIFGGMWGYATIKGASLDRRNRRLSDESDLSNGD